MNNIRGSIFLDESFSRDTKIYRTLSVERFFQMFEDKTNVVVRPSMWDDTFENLALASVFDTGKEKGTSEFKDDLFGQCWTLHTASDTIWRIYSNGTDGVRIRTTVGKLFDGLSGRSELGSVGETHLGRVKYHSDKGLREFADQHFVNVGLNAASIAKTLTIKRNAFSHENEVRLIYQSDTHQGSSVLKYSIDPNIMVDQVMLHPQLRKDEAGRLRGRIRKYLSYQGEVKRSLLYAPPKGFSFRI